MISKKLKSHVAKITLMSMIAVTAPTVLPVIEELQSFGSTVSVFAQEAGKVTVTCSSLWTYSSASWSAKIAVVSKGASFNVTDKVTLDGRAMYRLENGRYITANPAYVSFSGSAGISAPAPAPSVPAVSYRRTTANLNMRSGVGTSYGILTTIPGGTTVPVSGSNGGWYQVSYNGKTGWASGSYLQLLTSYSEKIIDIPYINQYAPVYAPMGCEGASLLMALQFKGSTGVSLKEFLENMPKTERNPFAGFASTPFAVVSGTPEIFQSIFPEALTSYGKNYSGSVTDISGYSTEQLKAEIDKGNPVVVYVTTRDYEAPKGKVYDMGEAGMVNIVDNMHVMVLTGYNSDGSYHVTDPASSRNRYWVSKAKFEASYNAIKWAVVVR